MKNKLLLVLVILMTVTMASEALAQEIVDTATQRRSNLIIMVTQGHHGILDALRGSVTEQVVRQAPCPVLAVPL